MEETNIQNKDIIKKLFIVQYDQIEGYSLQHIYPNSRNINYSIYAYPLNKKHRKHVYDLYDVHITHNKNYGKVIRRENSIDFIDYVNDSKEHSYESVSSKNSNSYDSSSNSNSYQNSSTSDSTDYKRKSESSRNSSYSSSEKSNDWDSDNFDHSNKHDIDNIESSNNNTDHESLRTSNAQPIKQRHTRKEKPRVCKRSCNRKNDNGENGNESIEENYFASSRSSNDSSIRSHKENKKDDNNNVPRENEVNRRYSSKKKDNADFKEHFTSTSSLNYIYENSYIIKKDASNNKYKEYKEIEIGIIMLYSIPYIKKRIHNQLNNKEDKEYILSFRLRRQFKKYSIFKDSNHYFYESVYVLNKRCRDKETNKMKNESIIITTELVNVEFFRKLLKFLGFVYFNSDFETLIHVYKNMQSWNHIKDMLKIELNYKEYVFCESTKLFYMNLHYPKEEHLETNPKSNEFVYQLKSLLNKEDYATNTIRSEREQIMFNYKNFNFNPFSNVNVYKALFDFREYFLVIFEMMLLGLPIIVLSKNIQRCAISYMPFSH